MGNSKNRTRILLKEINKYLNYGAYLTEIMLGMCVPVRVYMTAVISVNYIKSRGP